MKKTGLILVLGFLLSNGHAQNQATYEVGQGFGFELNNGDYAFNIGGSLQPEIYVEKPDGADAQSWFRSRRSFFRITGKSKPQKLSFMFLADFSDPDALLDAWLAYKPWEGVEVKAGQMLSPANNREMLFLEDHLSFASRSALSETYSRTGREFGLNLHLKKYIGKSRWSLYAMVASGDGRNSFGVDARDNDLGGLKYAARLDIFPLGDFKPYNDEQLADLEFEEKPKLVLGVAGSLNNGASQEVGEGHGGVELYNQSGVLQYANYRKLFGDVMFKYKGWAFLGEYGLGTASGLDNLYTDAFALQPLLPEQISGYYHLGSGFNSTLSYTYGGRWGLDVRYSQIAREFEQTTSLVNDFSAFDLGFTHYFNKQGLKFQLSAGQIQNNNVATLRMGLLCQIIF